MHAPRRFVVAIVCLLLMAACGAANEATPGSTATPSAGATAIATTAPPVTDASPAAASYALVARWGQPVILPMPADVATLPDGAIAVGGVANGEVALFDADGALQRRWRADASTRAIAASPDGAIYAWGGNGLLALDPDGDTRRSIPVAGMSPGQPASIVDLAVALDGTIYIAAGLGPGIETSPPPWNGVIALSPDGGELHRWELPDPLRLRQIAALPDGTLAVVLAVAKSAGPPETRGPDRILRLDPAIFSGDWEAGATPVAGLSQIDGLAALPDGGLAVIEAQAGFPSTIEETTLVRLAEDGSEAGRWVLADHGGRYRADSVGMTALPDGTLLVVDGANHRVLRIGTDGEVTGEVGGVRPGDFGAPRGVAIGPDDSISVIDGLLDRITVLTADGEISAQFALPWHSGSPELPGDIAIARDGRIYTAGEASEIAVLSPDGTVVDRWSRPAEEVGGRLHVFSPARLAIGGDDILYVAMYGEPALEMYTVDGETRGSWPFEASPERILDVATLGESAWAIVELREAVQIQRLGGPDAAAAAVVAEWSTDQQAPDLYPVSIALDPDGAIYLADPFARLIVKLDPDGKEISRWGLGVEQPDIRGAALSLTVGPDGRVYVADAGVGQVLIYAPA